MKRAHHTQAKVMSISDLSQNRQTCTKSYNFSDKTIDIIISTISIVGSFNFGIYIKCLIKSVSFPYSNMLIISTFLALGIIALELKAHNSKITYNSRRVK